MELITALIVVIASGVSAYVLVELIRRVLGARVVDIPNARSSHSRPTARGGGLAIVVVFAFGVLLAWTSSLVSIGSGAEAGFVMCALGIGIIGWLDDLYDLSVGLRMAAQVGLVLVFLSTISLPTMVGLPLVGTINVHSLSGAIWFVWILAATNIYNFMDGIDGIAGSQAVVGGAFWSFWGWNSGNLFVELVGLLLLSSAMGFLVHNWPPAKIFMGDVGSSFLGFTLAALVVVGSMSDPKAAFAGILVLWPFMLDGSFTLFRRLLRGENVLRAHRSHLYQRLVIAGFSHQSVTLLYGGLSLVGVVLAVLWTLDSAMAGGISVFVIAVLFLGLIGLTLYAESRATVCSASRT